MIELPQETQLIINQARANLVDFEIATNPKYKPNWHHELIAKELEHIEKEGDKDYKILIVTVPPRFGKSQQCSIDFPSWFLGRNPSKEIITASYSGELAQDFGGKTREKMNSDAFKFIFPEVTLREDEQARGHWRTKQGGGYISVGVGGALSGRGADCLLIDDACKNREEAESETQRKSIWDWFTSTAFTRLEPKGVVIIIMTRWHSQDLAGMILSNPELQPRTKLMKFEAITNGKPLWEWRYGIEALEEIKRTIGPYDWSSLYMGTPILSEDQEFKPEWIRKIPEVQLALMSTRRFLTIDTAMSKKSHADYTGFCDNSVDNQNFWYLRAWRKRLSPEELVDTLFTLHSLNFYESIGIEKTTYTEGLKPYLDAEQRRRKKFLPIVELKHRQQAKEIRIRGLIPRYASKSIFHVEGQCKELEEELFAFPMSKFDDISDATAYQLQIADGTHGTSVSIMKPSWTGYNKIGVAKKFMV